MKNQIIPIIIFFIGTTLINIIINYNIKIESDLNLLYYQSILRPPSILNPLRESEIQNRTLNPKPYENMLSKDEVGNAGWTILHSFSAAYPLHDDQQICQQFNLFVNLFGQFFTCPVCSREILSYVKKNPYKCGGRKQLKEWLCNFHNEVNVRTDKEIFDCSKYDEKWGGSVEEN